jgi:hypothetical protein
MQNDKCKMFNADCRLSIFHFAFLPVLSILYVIYRGLLCGIRPVLIL